MQAVDDLVERQRPHPRGGEFDRQRHAVEPRQISVTVPAFSSVTAKSGRARRARSVNNSTASSASDSDGTRQFTSPDTPERLTAGRQHRHPRAAAEHVVDQRGAGIEQMLAVVQHQQHPTIAR